MDRVYVFKYSFGQKDPYLTDSVSILFKTMEGATAEMFHTVARSLVTYKGDPEYLEEVKTCLEKKDWVNLPSSWRRYTEGNENISVLSTQLRD